MNRILLAICFAVAFAVALAMPFLMPPEAARVPFTSAPRQAPATTWTLRPGGATDAPPVDPTRCVEDEVRLPITDSMTLCLHIEGDGWRVIIT